MQIDLSVLVTVVLAVLGLIGALVALIYRAHVSSVERMQQTVDQMSTFGSPAADCSAERWSPPPFGFACPRPWVRRRT